MEIINSIEYSQGVCGDGAAILKDGQPMTIEEILSKLREYELFKTELVASVALPLKVHVAGVIAVCENKAKRA